MLTAAAAVLYFGYVNNHNCYIIISIVIRLVTRCSISTGTVRTGGILEMLYLFPEANNSY